MTQLRPSETAGESKPGRGKAALRAAAEILIIAAVCVAAYSASFRVGFLLDDFLHVDYAARAWQGEWQGFVRTFSGNWSGRTDNLTSYRPAISVSFLIDALLWRANAFGYHLTNVLMFIGCCILVRLISLELSTLSGLRFGKPAALCAALLFAVHPLHPESVTWIIGRVDVQCGLFYLASVAAYLRFRRLGRRRWLVASLAAFLAALPSKEMAVTLPAAVVLAEAILFFRRDAASGQHAVSPPVPYMVSLRESLLLVLPFWLLLGAYAAVRTVMIGTLVGGYGGSLIECWRNFFDKETVLKIWFPVNEEIGMPGAFKNILAGLYIALAGAAGWRLWSRLLDLRSLLFLAAWMVVAILPAYQIWHIHPNLVGSRLFFLPSAPFCIALAFLAVPAAAGAGARGTRLNLAIGGAGILTAIGALWLALLQLNLVPYIVAGRQMDTIKAQVESLAAGTPKGARTLFLDLPQDHQGAGMLGRPEFLEMLTKRPFAAQDLADRVLTVESPLAGSREYLNPGSLRQILASPRLHAVYKWDADGGQFVAWHTRSGAGEFDFSAGGPAAGKAIWEPAEVRPSQSTHWWAGSHAIARVVVFPDRLTVYPGSTGAVLTLPDTNVDPLAACTATVRLACTAGDTVGSTADSARLARDKVRFLWTTTAGAGAARSEIPFDEAGDGTARAYPARYRAWSLGGRVDSLGLKFLPGNYRVDLYGLHVSGADQLMPRLELSGNGSKSADDDPYSAWLFAAGPDTQVFACFDLARMPGAAGARLLATRPGKVFAPGVSPAGTAVEDHFAVPIAGSTLSGRFLLPADLLKEPGLRQVRVVALDANGDPLGWPSDPQSLWIDRR